MHPALIKAFEAKRATKAAKAAEDAAVQEVLDAISIGEIELTDNRFAEGRYLLQRVERQTFKYSAAVDALKEQEIFEGVATGNKTASLRFIEKDAE